VAGDHRSLNVAVCFETFSLVILSFQQPEGHLKFSLILRQKLSEAPAFFISN